MAASFVMSRSDVFPVGTTVVVTPGTDVSAGSGSAAVDSAVVQADGTLTFSALAYGVPYVASAAGIARVVRFRVSKSLRATTGDTTNTSAVIANVPDTYGMVRGMPVYGVGIPVGAQIKSVDSASQITLTLAATATASAVSLVIGGVWKDVVAARRAGAAV